MNVLSLFDGLSCGQIALKELGIKVDKYYASEIDKHAIKQTMLNFPDTIQLGSVTDVDVSKLDKIDLLIGGSPCTNFSFAGKRNGMSTTTNEEIYTLDRYLELKADGFQFEGQSYLFWEYMRILRDSKPNYFLLENVEMGEKWETILSEAIGIRPVHINSALVSAQNRRRLYWVGQIRERLYYSENYCYLCGNEKYKKNENRRVQEDFRDNKYIESKTDMCCVQCGKGLDYRPRYSFVEGWKKYEGKSPSSLSKVQFDEIKQNDGRVYDIIPVGVQGLDSLFGETINPIPQPEDRGILLKDILEDVVDEKYYLSADVIDKLVQHRERHKELGHGFGAKFHSKDEKMQALKVGGKGIDDLVCVAMRGRGENNDQQLEPNYTGKTNTITSVQKDNLVLVIPEATSKGYTEIKPGECFDFENPKSKTRRGRKMIEKSNSLMAQNMSFMNYTSDYRIRRLTPTECSRLQTIPEWYRWECSETQAYKMLGNGWNIETIVHILKFMK